MESENNKDISRVDTFVSICTKVKDRPTLHMLYALTPEFYQMASISYTEELLEKGDLYLVLFDGRLFPQEEFEPFTIDRGRANGETPIIGYKSVLVDNFVFAMLLRYAFEFTPETSGHE